MQPLGGGKPAQMQSRVNSNLKLSTMKRIHVIKLNDGSIHESEERAARHLYNQLSSGVCAEIFEDLARKNALAIKNLFIDREKEIFQALQIVRELNEIEEQK